MAIRTCLSVCVIDRNIIPREEMSMHRIREGCKPIRTMPRTCVGKIGPWLFFVSWVNDRTRAAWARGIRLSAAVPLR